MPRPTRIEFEQAFYHVMNRGRARQRIFHKPVYYETFLETLAEVQSRFEAVIHAYCLLGNHYHLLVETPRANLGRIMRHVNGVYTQRYNRLRKTEGPQFRGRYKAIVVDEEAYLLPLSRYIHRQPVETKRPLVDRLETYEWSSYPAYIGRAETPAWLTTERVHGVLGRRQPLRAYRRYVEAGIDEYIARFYNKGNIATVLGDKTFREEIMARRGLETPDAVEMAWRDRPDARLIIERVAQYYQRDPATLRDYGGKRTQRNTPRKVAMYLCQQRGDMPLKAIAKVFGLNHYGSVSRSIADVKHALGEGDETLEKAVAWLEKQL